MKHKKLIATLSAMVLAMAPMTVSASALTEPGDGTSQEVTGDVYYENTTIYKVTLPTTSALEFALDPQGLLSLSDGQGGDSAGTIVGTGSMSAKNESSVPITLTGKFYVVDSANTVSLLANDAELDDTKAAISMQIVSLDGTGSSASAPSDVTGYTGTSVDVVGTSLETATKQDYTMAAATYKFTGDKDAGFEYALDSTSDDASVLFMSITGKVAKDYDWTAYSDGTNTLKLNAVFGFSDPAAVPADRAPSAGTTSTYDLSDVSGTVSVDLGAGASASTISSVTFGGNGTTFPNVISSDDYSLSGDTLTYAVEGWASQAAGSTKYLKIEFADGTSQIVTVTLQE